MPVKIRLARHGRKRKPLYHIVVADSRAPRDGRLIERIGTYNPNTNPATIELSFDKALSWLTKGAQPTDTCRAILSYKGVLMKKHLLDGVKKGAFDEASAETKFENWKREKLAKIEIKRDSLALAVSTDEKKRLINETKVKEVRSQALARKKAALAAKESDKSDDDTVVDTDETVSEEAPVEVVAEDVKATEAEKTQE